METKGDWKPLPPDLCDCCGRERPGWWTKRNEHIADSLGEVSSRRLAKAYGMSEDRVRQIAVDVLGQRAYIERVMQSEGWAISHDSRSPGITSPGT